MSIDDKKIMDLLHERGVLRFSTLMLRFHISSMEASRIVDEYKKKGIIDDKGKATSGIKMAWKNPYAEDNTGTDPKEELGKRPPNKVQENSEPTQQEIKEKTNQKKKESESDLQNIPKSKDKKNSGRAESKPVQQQSSDGLLSTESSSKKTAKNKPGQETVSIIKQKSPVSKPVQMSFLEESEVPKPRRKASIKSGTRKRATKKKDIDGQISLF